MSRTSPLKVAATVLAMVAVAVLGLALGKRMGQRQIAPESATFQLPEVILKPGAQLPEVALSAPAGEQLSSLQLLAESGAVVLFLDLDCSPCTEAVGRWQVALDEATLGDGQWLEQVDPRLPLIGITRDAIDRIAPYRALHGLTFPIYHDAGARLRDDYLIQSFPFYVVAARDGKVLANGVDQVLAADQLERLLIP